jgi:hypothetical protein
MDTVRPLSAMKLRMRLFCSERLWVWIDLRVSMLYNVDKSLRLSVMYAYIRSNETLPYTLTRVPA